MDAEKIIATDQIAIFAAVCALDLGGVFSRYASEWFSRPKNIFPLSSQAKKAISEHLLKALNESKVNNTSFENYLWPMFVEHANSMQTDSYGNIEMPPYIFALAIFYASNTGVLSQKAFDTSHEGIVSIEDFRGMLDLGIRYDQDFLHRFLKKETTSDVGYSKKSLEKTFISEKDDLRDAISVFDIKRAEKLILESNFPSLLVLQISGGTFLENLKKMSNEFESDYSKKLIRMFDESFKNGLFLKK